MKSDKFFTYIEKHPIAQGIGKVCTIFGILWMILAGAIISDEFPFISTNMFMFCWLGNAFFYMILGEIIEHIFKDRYRGELVTDYFSVFCNEDGVQVVANGREVNGDIILKKKGIPDFIKQRCPGVIAYTLYKLPGGNSIYSVKADPEMILFLNDTIIMENDRIYHNRIEQIYETKKVNLQKQQNERMPVTSEYIKVPVAVVKEQSKNDTYILVAMEGRYAGKRWKLDKSVRLGLDVNCCQIVFPPDTIGVDRVHCEVGCRNGSLYLRDFGSSYGITLAEGQVVTNYQEVQLESSDTFRLNDKDKFMIIKN